MGEEGMTSVRKSKGRGKGRKRGRDGSRRRKERREVGTILVGKRRERES